MILNSNHNYKDANFKLTPDVAHNNSINFRTQQYIQNYLNYNHNKNNNFLNQANLFNINNFAMNNYMTQYAQQMNSKNINNIISPINNYNNNNNYNSQFGQKNYHNFKEKFEISCICDKSYFCPKNDLKQCILCRKYQHKSCINQAKEITPYICFNCQFENNHFYLRWKKAILSAKEFIYKKKWEEDPSFLKEGTKDFEFELNLQELYDEFQIKPNNNNDNNSYYLAILCLTNNGRPFHLGFPDNINIEINNKKFYNTESKGFKRPLLLALENNKYYIKKRRHLITLDKYEIPNAAEFFTNKNNNNNCTQKITISFSNNLENYRGSEFEFVDVRHYLIYIGVFQEIEIPQMSLLRECKNLEEYSMIFKNFYDEKVKKIKWNKIANYISMDSEQLSMNMISEISNQKIICPVRGLFCQHSEVMDFGECCGYITSNNQVYKCFKCNRPLNIMYIDEMSERIFNKYKNENYSLIYFSNKFKFIRGEKLEDNSGKNEKSNNKQIDVEPSDESLSESFFKYYENKANNDETLFNDNNEANNINNNDIIEINSDNESVVMEPNNNDFNNNIYLRNPLPDNYNMNLEQKNKKGNELSKTNTNNINNVSNNSNDNSKNQDNIVVINNLDKSDDDMQPSENMENNVVNNNKNNINEENKNEEQVINLMDEEDDDINDLNENNKDNISSNLNNNNNNEIIDKENEKEKENITDNSVSFPQNQVNKSSSIISNFNVNNNSESSSNTRKNDINNFLENVQEINQEKSTTNIFNSDSSKDSKENTSKSMEEKEHEFLDKKRNKEIHKRKKKVEINKEKVIPEENDIHSPRKRRFRRIEDGFSNNAKNKKNVKEREIIMDRKKRKGKENNNKNNNNKSKINKPKNIIDKTSVSNSNESLSKENDNYLNISIYKDKEIINSSESNSHNNNKNRLSKNKIEIKNKRRNSDMTSSSNSYNTQSNNNVNVTNSEYESQQRNINKVKKNKKLKKNIEKEKNKEKEKLNKYDDNDLSSNRINNNVSENNAHIQMIDNMDEDSKIMEEDDYETILIDSKDLIEVKPFNEKRESNRIMNGEEDEESINDYEIFENDLLDNNQMEFVNYDYYNIQRKLREYCSLRYQDDEIFNGNKTFFNKFK